MWTMTDTLAEGVQVVTTMITTRRGLRKRRGYETNVYDPRPDGRWGVVITPLLPVWTALSSTLEDVTNTHREAVRRAMLILRCRFAYTDPTTRVPPMIKDLTHGMLAVLCYEPHPVEPLICSRAVGHTGRHLAARYGYVRAVWGVS